MIITLCENYGYSFVLDTTYMPTIEKKAQRQAVIADLQQLFGFSEAYFCGT